MLVYMKGFYCEEASGRRFAGTSDVRRTEIYLDSVIDKFKLRCGLEDIGVYERIILK